MNIADYRKVLVDTNIISVISKNEEKTLEGFMHVFPPNSYIPCFTLYNLRELKKCDNGAAGNAYERAVRLFSLYPCMVIYPYKTIVQMEIDDYYAQRGIDVYITGFSSLPPGNSFIEFVNHFWSDKALVDIIKREEYKIPEVVTCWNKAKAEIKYSKQAELVDFELGEIYMHLSQNYKFNIPLNGFDVTRFPGLRMMLLSNQRKIYFRKSLIEPGDVMDSMISCAAPYVDAVCTENSQAEIYKLAKIRIPQIAQLEIRTMSDLRMGKRSRFE